VSGSGIHLHPEVQCAPCEHTIQARQFRAGWTAGKMVLKRESLYSTEPFSHRRGAGDVRGADRHQRHEVFCEACEETLSHATTVSSLSFARHSGPQKKPAAISPNFHALAAAAGLQLRRVRPRGHLLACRPPSRHRKSRADRRGPPRATEVLPAMAPGPGDRAGAEGVFRCIVERYGHFMKVSFHRRRSKSSHTLRTIAPPVPCGIQYHFKSQGTNPTINYLLTSRRCLIAGTLLCRFHFFGCRFVARA